MPEPPPETPHPVSALTSSELTYYRRRLENAIAYFDKQDSVPAARAAVQGALDAVRAEQDDRARLAALACQDR
jgi:hypothetical protein